MNLTITKVNNGFIVSQGKNSPSYSYEYQLGGTYALPVTDGRNVFTNEAALFKYLSKQFAQTKA